MMMTCSSQNPARVSRTHLLRLHCESSSSPHGSCLCLFTAFPVTVPSVITPPNPLTGEKPSQKQRTRRRRWRARSPVSDSPEEFADLSLVVFFSLANAYTRVHTAESSAASKLPPKPKEKAARKPAAKKTTTAAASRKKGTATGTLGFYSKRRVDPSVLKMSGGDTP